MRVGLAQIGAGLDAHRDDALGDHGPGDVLEAAEKALEPALQVQAVPEDQLRALGAGQIAGRGLVVVDLGAGPGDGDDLGRVSGHVAGHVGDDGEGGDHLELAACLGGRAQASAQGESEGEQEVADAIR